MAEHTQFNVALPPSTVHLAKMFWVAHDVKCHGDTLCGHRGEGLNCHFTGQRCVVGPRYVSCEHTIKRGGVKVKGEGED